MNELICMYEKVSLTYVYGGDEPLCSRDEDVLQYGQTTFFSECLTLQTARHSISHPCIFLNFFVIWSKLLCLRTSANFCLVILVPSK